MRIRAQKAQPGPRVPKAAHPLLWRQQRGDNRAGQGANSNSNALPCQNYGVLDETQTKTTTTTSAA
nr:unnamed protein product [Digitaria exilis]